MCFENYVGSHIFLWFAEVYYYKRTQGVMGDDLICVSGKKLLPLNVSELFQKRSVFDAWSYYRERYIQQEAEKIF